MSHQLVQTRYLVSQTVLENLTADRTFGAINFAATAADIKFAYAPSGPIEVVRFGVIAKTAIIVGAGMILTLGKSAVLNDLSAPTNFATLTTTATIAANKGLYRDVATAVAQAAGDDALGGAAFQTSLVNVKPLGPMPVNPGEAAIITLTDVADTSGTGWLFIEYNELGFSGVNLVNLTRKTS